MTATPKVMAAQAGMAKVAYRLLKLAEMDQRRANARERGYRGPFTRAELAREAAKRFSDDR